ncbi:MAG: heterodisulfide reductase-related iron-sulfur binding cluster, partial [Actinomycetota bacterium]
ELSDFLVNVLKVQEVPGRVKGSVTYHDSCSGLRELGVKMQPRYLLQMAGAGIAEMDGAERCCGFGGTFSGRYPEVSTAMADSKIADVDAASVDLLVSADPGCLLQLEGRMSRTGSPVRVRHVASLLREALA